MIWQVNYTVIFQGESNGLGYSVEYDCGEVLGIVNYCIHILSREPTMPDELRDSLVDRSLKLGLNTQSLNLTITHQDGCW